MAVGYGKSHLDKNSFELQKTWYNLAKWKSLVSKFPSLKSFEKGRLMVTLDEAIDTVLELPPEQQEMLLDIIYRRQVEARRQEIAGDAQ
jgi:hypothetical protein